MIGRVLRSRLLPLSAALVCALAVGAVVVQGAFSPAISAPPEGPRQQDVDDYLQLMLDETWNNTGLSEEIEQPPAVDAPVLPVDVWGDAFYTCMAGLGYDLVSYSWSDGGGYQLSDATGEVIDDHARPRLAKVASYELDEHGRPPARERVVNRFGRGLRRRVRDKVQGRVTQR